MRKILFALLLLTGTCLAEKYSVTFINDKKCNNMQYDSYTHEWTPKGCSAVIECYVTSNKYKISTQIEIAVNLDEYQDSYKIHDGVYVLEELSAVDFSMLLSSGAIGTCATRQPVFIVPKSK